MDKPALRRHFRALRESLPPEYVTAASAAICRRLAAWLPSVVSSSIPSILAYLAFRCEPDLGLLFDLLPQAHWAVPRIEGNVLAIHCYDPARLTRHRFGMLEPAADLPRVDPATLDVVLTPGVAFDRHGRRLGYGGGYYDRFLSTTPALRVGVAFDINLVEELPCDERDQRMDWIVTPSTLFAV